jgi:hypothetical protein
MVRRATVTNHAREAEHDSNAPARPTAVIARGWPLDHKQVRGTLMAAEAAEGVAGEARAALLSRLGPAPVGSRPVARWPCG